MNIITIILILILIIEIKFKPRIGRIKTGAFILWYGNKNRKFIIF